MKAKRRRSNIVPRVVFGTVCIGVVPLCVLECGSGSGGGPQTCQYGCCPNQCLGVAAIGYDQYVGSPDGEAGSGDATDAPSEAGDGGEAG
jgi:hypothetical protein